MISKPAAHPEMEGVDPSKQPEVAAKEVDMAKECKMLTEFMKVNSGDKEMIKSRMDSLLKERGLINANVVIMNSLQNLKEEKFPHFKTLDEIVLEKKLAWIGELWPNVDFKKGQKEFEAPSNAIGSNYYPEDPDKKVEIKKSTLSLKDLQECLPGKDNPVQELCGTCGTIAVAQAMAKDNLSQTDFLKLMVIINHYSDLADKNYIQNALTETNYQVSREAMPGNKDLNEIMNGITLLTEEKLTPIHAFIKDDFALAVTTEYNHKTNEGEAEVKVFFKPNSEEFESKKLNNTVKLTNLQLIKPEEEEPEELSTNQLSSMGLEWIGWDEFCENAKNKTTTIGLIVPAEEGHYVEVEHDTLGAKVKVRESAANISSNLTSLEFIPITFSCHGAPQNNMILIESYLESNAIDCENLSEFFQAFGTIKNALSRPPGEGVDYIQSSKTLNMVYEGMHDLPKRLKKVVQNTKKFDKVVMELGVKPEESRKLNLLIELYNAKSKDVKVEFFFEELKTIMDFEGKEISPDKCAKLRELFNSVSLEYLERLY